MANPNSIAGLVTQSPPVNLRTPYDPAWLHGKTIVITGGASGFGAGFFQRWAEYGANIIIGDVNDEAGRALVAAVRTATGNPHHHYLHVDVRDWQSQVDFFRAAVKLSPHGGIDGIVANAGIKDANRTFLAPRIDDEEPPKPNFNCLDVNLVGVMYTAHLAMHYLPRNPHSKDASPDGVPGEERRDRHLLLIGSIASVAPVPGQLIYAVAKHGVMGLWRTLRIVNPGVRVNIICPYFIDTAMLSTVGRLILAGGAVGKAEDVVEAGTRLMADTRIVGRGLAVGPKVGADDDGVLVEKDSPATGEERAIWELYADDFEQTDLFLRRFVGLTNHIQVVKGWSGWLRDTAYAIYGGLIGNHPGS